MKWVEDLKNSDMSNIDKIVEVIYRNCDCNVCDVIGIKCPYQNTSWEEMEKSDCRPVIKNGILEAAKNNA